MANRIKQLRECYIISMEITDFCCQDFVAKIPSNCITKEFCSNLISRKKVAFALWKLWNITLAIFLFFQKIREINFLTDKLHCVVDLTKFKLKMLFFSPLNR